MATERIKLFEADIDIDGIIKKSSELKTELENLRDRQKELKASGDTTSETYVKLEARLKNVATEYRINQQQVSNLTAASGANLTVTQKLDAAIGKQIVTEGQAINNNKELRRLKKDVNVTTDEGRKAVEEINKKINENTAFLKENADAYVTQKMEIGNYKGQIMEAYQELNIMNGDLGGFIARAQQAGGVMPLIQNGLKGIITGVVGMTKASLAFIATPIGAVIAAIGFVLGAVITYLKSTQEGIDMVTKVTRPLTAIFQTLIGVLQDVGKFLVAAFTNPKKSLTELYEFVKNQLIRQFEAFAKIVEGILTFNWDLIKEGFSDLGDQVADNLKMVAGAAKEFGDRMVEAAKRGAEIDRIQKEIEKREASIALEREKSLDAFKEQELIAKDATKTTAEREAAAKEALRITKQQINAEKEILALKIQAMELEHMNNDTSREDLKALNDLKAQMIALDRQGKEKELSLIGVLSAAEKERQKAGADAAKKAFEDSLKRQELEIQLYLESQGIKAKTMEEELKIAEEVFQKRIELEKRKLAAGKMTQEEYNLFILKNEKDLAQRQAEIAADNLKREFEAFKKNHESKIEQGQFFSDELYSQEVTRLNDLLTAEQEYWDKKLELGTINQQEYNDEIAKLNEEHQSKLDEARLLREEAEKEKKAIDLENERALRQENLEYDLEFQLQELEAKRLQEVEAAEKTGADITLINEKYAQMRKEIEEAVEMNRVALASQTAGDMATILGKESALGKAAAIAQTTMDTYQAAVSAYKAMSGIPIVGPALGAVAAGAAVAMGLSNVKKIASTKPPKAERGMAIDIGGKRHSAGGTKFYGEDGTAFEAEKGEKMFILSRRASAALAPLLSDINQQYGGVSLAKSSTYLASGGQVLRSRIPGQDIDYNKMGELVREGVREGSLEGSRQGSMEGSSRGTYSGMVDKETNEMIEAGAKF